MRRLETANGALNDAFNAEERTNYGWGKSDKAKRKKKKLMMELVGLDRIVCSLLLRYEEDSKELSIDDLHLDECVSGLSEC